MVRAYPTPPPNSFSIQLLHLLGRSRHTIFPSLHTCPTGAYHIICTNGAATVSHPRLVFPFFDMCKAYGSQHGPPRGATPVVQRHFLLRLGRRRITHPCTRVAHSCGSPGTSTVQYPAGAGHLQVRQRHRLSYPTVRRSTRADRGLSVLAPRITAREYPEFLDLRRARTILALTNMPATFGSTALWALVPVALHLSLERAPVRAGHKTEIRVLGFASGYGAPFAVLWPLILAPVWLAARDARAPQASLSIDPASAIARLQQGLPTTEVEQEQGTAGVTKDEMVPPALLSQLAFFASGTNQLS